MSAVHGPMPCTAVSSAWASSAGSEVSAARSSVPSSTALAIAFRVRIFAADRPMRWSLAGRARRTASDPNGSNAALRRPQIAPALAVETCCDTTMAASPANPPGRRRSGGGPARAEISAKRGSAASSAFSPTAKSASLSMRGYMRLTCSMAGPHSHSASVPADARGRMSISVFRFAPSPNGYLHLGHALSALINFDMARAVGGRFLLRIEDIDRTRCRPEFEAAIYEDLAWLGIAWEEPVRRQGEHFGDYRAALARLEVQGFVYASFESRAEITALVAERESIGPWPRDPDGVPLYPGTAKSLSPAERQRRIETGA